MSRERKKNVKFELRYNRAKKCDTNFDKILTKNSTKLRPQKIDTRGPTLFERRRGLTSALCALGQSYAACGRGAGCSHNNQCSSPHQPGWPRSLRSQRPACLALPKWCNHNSRGSAADLCSQVARVPSKAGLARFARSGPPCWWVRAFGPDS